MDDLLSEFLTECFENLAQLDVELVNLEQRPNDPELLGSIFRMVHTIKGTCGFLGLPRLERLTHAAENVLGKFRDGELAVGPDAVSLILQSLDRIKFILDELEATEAEPDGSDDDLITRLNVTAEGGSPATEAEGTPAPNAETVAADAPEAATNEPEVEAAPVEEVTAVAAPEAPPSKTPPTETTAPDTATQPDAQAATDRGPSVADQSLRVQVDLLEDLMTLVSELVLTRNQLLQMVRNDTESKFKAPLQRLSHITSELQEGVMKTRMQQIGNAWGKLPRLIRDLSVDLGKQIELRMLGAETELDRQVLDLIKDPLTHMVRNSADHGIELPAERRAAGKPESGTITLNAFHEGGQILIEIADDGRGLDAARIGRKAVEAGLCDESELAAMPPQQIYQFIWHPGFSTAAAVTSVSGRGVGMDVVKTNIEKIGGSLDLSSEPGRGTRLLIKIPLTLAIVPALIVEAGSERFAVPQIGVVELVRAGPRAEHRIEVIDGSPILRLRDQLLPLVRLSSLLGLSDDGALTEEGVCVVVSQVGSSRFGLVVDQVFDTEEIVVKPVSPLLKSVRCFSGNTILGDGSVVLILDMNDLVGGIAATPTELAAELQQGSGEDEKTPMLLFRAGEGGPKAVPLGLITRLEEMDLAEVENACGRSVVQYRNELMPLTDVYGSANVSGTGRSPVLVFTDAGHNMGMLVDQIIDIAEERVDVKHVAEGAGMIGSAVIAGHATDIIDISHYVTNVFGGWFEAEDVEPYHKGEELPKRVLLVDDSAFFRNLLTPILAGSEYAVTAVDGPERAFALRDRGEMFDVIISDIEMPGMDGFEFVTELRRDGAWKVVPVVALTSHTTSADIERGREAGFTDYVGKLERESLLRALNQSVELGRVLA